MKLDVQVFYTHDNASQMLFKVLFFSNGRVLLNTMSGLYCNLQGINNGYLAALICAVLHDFMFWPKK